MNLSAMLTMNASGFMGGLAGARSAMSQTLSGMNAMRSGVASMVGSMIPAVGAIGGVAGAGELLHKTLEGVKESFNLGRELAELKARTGETGETLMKLRTGFSMYGLTESMAGSLSLMQRSIAGVNESGQPTKAIFDKLGMSMDDLKGKGAAEQFQEIAAKIRSIPDAAARTTAAMEIFGRSGAALLPLIMNASAIPTQLSPQAALLAKNAETFERVTQKLDKVGKVLQGFFVGIADKIAPVLEPLLDRFNKMDFSKWGQQIGTAIAVVGEAFNEGKLGELVGLSLQVGFGTAVNYFVGAMQAAFAAITNILPLVFSRDFFEGLEFGIVGAFQLGVASLITMLSEPLKFIQDGFQFVFENASRFLAQHMISNISPVLMLIDKVMGGKLSATIQKGLEAVGVMSTGRSFAEVRESNKGKNAEMFGETTSGIAKYNADQGNQNLKLAGDKIGPKLEQMGAAVANAFSKMKPADIIAIAGSQEKLAALVAGLKANIPESEPTEETAKSGTFDFDKKVKASSDGGTSRQHDVDRLEKIGLFVGGMNSGAIDHARATAQHTKTLHDWVKAGAPVTTAGGALGFTTA